MYSYKPNSVQTFEVMYGKMNVVIKSTGGSYAQK